MPIKIKANTSVKRLLTKTERGLIPSVRKEFSNKFNLARVKRLILQDMIRGVSPVKGGGKWKRYSKSYKEVIRGKAAYRRLPNGRVIRISADSVESRFKKGKQNLVNDLNADFKRSQKPSKRISPVNLRLSGKLHKSLFAKTVGGFLRTFRLRIGFNDKLADIHNRRGAGKSRVTRRLLPTKFGESFNRRITSGIFELLQKSVEKVVKEFNRQ